MTSPIAPPVDWLRKLQLLALPDQAAIGRYVETNTPDGVEQGWQTIASGIACRVDVHRTAASERGEAAGALVGSISQWIVHLPALTDVTERDRITITATDRTDGRTFEAVSVHGKSYETIRGVLCILIA